MWDGISVYDSEDSAGRQVRRYRRLGREIAVVEVADARAIRAERTTGSAGLHTVWGDAAALLACVRMTLPV